VKKPYYNIKNGANEADIYIFGIIGSSWYESGNTASQFVRDFKALEEKYDRINIRINSPGGSIWEGLPIVNAIRASKKDTHTYNEGIAYSMGAEILVAGKTVHSFSNAMTMLHNASTVTWGNSKLHRKGAEDLDKYDDSLIETFADKTGLSSDEVRKKWFNFEDNYFTAKEALAAGIIDVIEDTKVKKLPEDLSNFTMKKALAYFDQLDEKEEDSFIMRVTDGVKKKLTHFISNISHNTQPMEFQKSLSLLEKENLSKEDRESVIAEIKSVTGPAERFTKAELDAAVLKATENVTKDLDAQKKALADAQKQNADQAKEIEDLKKIVPESKGAIQLGGDKGSASEEEEEYDFSTPIDEERKAMNGL
jgi:ATP-dependent protease ClpP protease subunit